MKFIVLEAQARASVDVILSLFVQLKTKVELLLATVGTVPILGLNVGLFVSLILGIFLVRRIFALFLLHRLI